MMSVLNRLNEHRRYGSALVIGVCALLILSLSPDCATAQDGLSETAAVSAWFDADEQAANHEVLRERVVDEGTILLHVTLLSNDGSTPLETLQRNDLKQVAEDLLFALPEGSYSQIEPGSNADDFTLRVDAAGLDGLLGAPQVARVALASPPAMRRMAAGSAHNLAIKSDNSLWTWGNNSSGELGDGTRTTRLKPVKVLTGVTAAATGGTLNFSQDLGWIVFGHSLAIKSDKSLWTWGSNWLGQLGDGTNMARPKPVKVLTGVAAVAAGELHSLALKTDGSLWAWGSNWWGQLGNGNTTDRLKPVKVLTGVAAVAAGSSHSLALKTDGSLWTWGRNDTGQLGDGTTTQRLSPVKVLTGVAAMAAGSAHSLALKTDGSLWAWGGNYSGQIGDGTTTTRPRPVKVLTGVVAVAASDWHSLALKSDGSLWAWGWNVFGQLGDGTATARSKPVKVLTGVTAMAAGYHHSLARRTDGSLWAWGDNEWAQLGNGTKTDRLKPGRVSGF